MHKDGEWSSWKGQTQKKFFPFWVNGKYEPIKETISNQHINEIIIKTIKENNDIMKYAIGNKILFQQNNNNSNHQIGLVDLHFRRIMYFDYWIL